MGCFQFAYNRHQRSVVSRSWSQQPTLHPVRLDLVLLARSVRRSVSHAVAVQPRRCGKTPRGHSSTSSTDCFVVLANDQRGQDEPKITHCSYSSVHWSQCRFVCWAQVKLTCGERALTRRISSRGCSHMLAQSQSGCGRLVRCYPANQPRLPTCSSSRASVAVRKHERLTHWLHLLRRARSEPEREHY